MAYNEKEIVKMMKVFHAIESEAKDFLYLSAFAMKYKDKIKESAQKAILAIEEYKRLPLEIRKELERDTTSYVNKINELEKACRKFV